TQRRRRGGGGLPAGLAHVRHAVLADTTVGVGQRRRPGDGVVAVVELVSVQVEDFTIRGPATPHILQCDRVPGGGGPDRVEGERGQGQHLLVVGSALHQHRVPARLGGAKDVGPEHRSVAHGGRDVPLHHHVHAGTLRTPSGAAQGYCGPRRLRYPPQPMRGTLDGIRVLDLTRNIAGPYCTMILADLGADTVKVERCDGGDDTRGWSPPSWNGESAMFLSVNRNKRSLGVDLDADEGAAIVRRLAQGADVM